MIRSLLSRLFQRPRATVAENVIVRFYAATHTESRAVLRKRRETTARLAAEIGWKGRLPQ